jgi:hypothetical protein
MAGIDDIGGQVLPQGEDEPLQNEMGARRDGPFYHYGLAKLAQSAAALEPRKKGRAMCEVFGNYGWDEGDQLTLFYGTQWEDSDGMPRATMTSQKVVLDLMSEQRLWDVVSEQGFRSVNGCLGMGIALENAGAAFVHSRDKGDGTTKVSSQKLKVVSDILSDYQTDAALKASANSYGGINTKAVYLNPASSLSDLAVALNTGGSSGTTDSGNNGTTGGGTTDNTDPTDDNGGGGSTDNGGGDAGGSGNGDE